MLLFIHEAKNNVPLAFTDEGNDPGPFFFPVVFFIDVLFALI
jgi:hypothetical protein